MTKTMNFILVLVLYTLSSTASAVQTCRSQNEIPALTPTESFIDHDDGTVTDSQTGLMWTKCVQGLSGNSCASGSAAGYSWEEALNLASTSVPLKLAAAQYQRVALHKWLWASFRISNYMKKHKYD